MTENRTKSDAYMLRLPDGMREQIKAAAAANHRSMNDEIIARLSGTQANLRDQIAIAALGGMLAHSRRYQPREKDRGKYWHMAISAEAFDIADAFIAAREGGDANG